VTFRLRPFTAVDMAINVNFLIYVFDGNIVYYISVYKMIVNNGYDDGDHWQN